jgi:hypothetical protein
MNVLRTHGTPLNRLKPVNILQAAEADMRLLNRKDEGKADPEATYSFLSRHVRRARTVTHLIALAYFEPLMDGDGNLRTNKDSTHTIYNDTELLRITLGHLVLFNADADALRKVEL